MIRRFFGSTVRQQGSSFNMLDYNPAVWLDAQDASSVILTDGKVSQWSDKSGNNNHAFRPDPSKRPIYAINAVSNGFPSIEVTNGGDVGLYLTNTSLTSEIISVVSYKTGVESFFENINSLFTVKDGFTPGVAGDTNTPNLRSGNWTSQVFKNGNTQSTNVILPLPLTVCNFRGNQVNIIWDILRNSNSLPERNWPGFIGEAIFFTNQLAAVDRTEIVNHLMTKWGIP